MMFAHQVYISRSQIFFAELTNLSEHLCCVACVIDLRTIADEWCDILLIDEIMHLICIEARCCWLLSWFGGGGWFRRSMLCSWCAWLCWRPRTQPIQRSFSTESLAALH